MKRLITILAVVLLTANLLAQSPQKISYQAVIRDGDSKLVTTQIGMQISILQGSETGTPVYVETHTPTPNANGLVSLIIGEGTLVSGDLTDINWSAGPYFIKTETAVVPPLTTYTITGTSQLLSVPYALHAKTVAGYTETDPVYAAWNKSTGINITASQVSDFQTSVTNNAAMLLNTAKVTNATHTGDATGSEVLTLATVNSDAGTFNNITINAKGLATAGSNVSYLTSETDPLWTTASANYYTKTNMQTSGESQLHFNNLTNTPTTIAGFGITDAVTTSGNQTISGDKSFAGNITATTGVFNDLTVNGAITTTTGNINATTGVFNDLTVITNFTGGGSGHFNSSLTVNGAITASGGNSTNWNTAYGWGDHSTEGYFANGGETGGAARTLGNKDIYSLGFKTSNVTRLLINDWGDIGIGTESPVHLLQLHDLEIPGNENDDDGDGWVDEATLAITGNVKIVDGTQGAGKVLTSDADGTATWAAPGGGGSHYIGESYGGGIVFYVYDNGKHGLIVATADQSNSLRWYAGTNKSIMAFADGVGAGKANTAIIIASQGFGDGATYAARICNEYSVTVDGVTYGDWYLPSKFELNLLYLQNAVIGGFGGSWYCSSTEDDSDNARSYRQDFYDGAIASILKNLPSYVRAIRAF